MYIKTINYTDFNGNKREATLHFNLTLSELRKISINPDHDILKELSDVYGSKNFRSISAVILDFIKFSYGQLSEDGLSFKKKDKDGTPLYDEFEQTAAYDAFVDQLYDDEFGVVDFAIGIMPKDVAVRMKEAAAKESPELAAAFEHRSSVVPAT